MRSRDPASVSGLPRLRRMALVAMGWTIIVAGVLAMPLPGPFGLPIAFAGALLLLRNSPDARKTLIRWKRKAPARLSPIVGRFEAWRTRRRLKRRAG